MAQVVIQTVTRVKGGDDVIVKGTVDGVAAQAHVWFSYVSTLATLAAKKQYLARQLAAAVPTADVDLTGALSGTITV